MFSRARIFGHPIHPMLIPLPVTSFVLGFVSLVVFSAGGDPFWLRAGHWLAIFGVVTGLLAAVPGLMDFLSIPANYAAKSVATAHLLLNVTIVALYFASWLLMGGFGGPTANEANVPLILQLIGVVLLLVSGWLGWEMVYRHHIAIEPLGTEEQQLVESFQRRHAA